MAVIKYTRVVDRSLTQNEKARLLLEQFASLSALYSVRKYYESRRLMSMVDKMEDAFVANDNSWNLSVQ